ncbi:MULTISPECIES: cellulase family glycosylhydrolase [unclassified Sphingomonas]|uniref:glycoside hydrolase 5 family protein n=1 Tax=Sphingomonas TaxID=13687 RepID=UPI0009630EDA|nr:MULTISPECIES: cellulase family glycosylhydrolase [unclassified Sphingomonas]MBN8813093.1 cellulase family glycosylhydrolase [Sphingomonas sp.]OJY54184.1 MAG: mannanase [Sphingomonas sp. 67-41]
MFTRRSVLGSGAAALAGTALPLPVAAASPGDFVTRRGTGLFLGGKPHRFVGANMWYAAWLGADAPWGNRDRLRRELDALAAMGVRNLRIAASAEDSPLRNSVKPAFRTRGSAWNPALVEGLAFALSELARRDMKAVLYLTNFWEWSGGMMTYLSWANGGKYLDMNDPAHPWPAFPDMAAQFYANAEAVGLYRDYVRATVERHAGDPAIMAWQLANEPRPGGSAKAAEPLLSAYYGWIQGTARLIKSLAPRHLVSTGSEGLMGSIERADIYRAAHGFPEIDYLTAHIWPLNWGWVDAGNLAGTNEASFARVREYIARHIALATELGKPLVIEEFGYPRDGGGYDPESATRFRDLYYKLIYDAVEASARAGGPITGSNFWAWNGEGRPAHGDHRFRPGDTAWLGDPPHEPQGWYGVFDGDATTRAAIQAHAHALAATHGD